MPGLILETCADAVRLADMFILSITPWEKKRKHPYLDSLQLFLGVPSPSPYPSEQPSSPRKVARAHSSS
jgi:hypothetical protein